MAKQDSIPPPADLAALAAEAVLNAGRLVREAQALLDLQAWPSAQVLATLAFEEVGKAHLCVTTLGVPPGIEVRDFWQGFRNHEVKLYYAYMLAALVGSKPPASTVSETLQAASDAATDDNSAKFRGLYVDYRDGVVLRPSDINEVQARAMVEKVLEIVDCVTLLYSPDNFHLLFDPPAELLAELDDRMRGLAEQAPDTDALMWVMRQELRAGGDSP